MAEPGAELDLIELEKTTHLRANIGSGDYPLNFFINVDSDPEKSAQIHAQVPPMPFEDEELEHIYAGHFLEHLGYVEGGEFLAECYRCLKPGGRLGIVVPDTQEIVVRWLNRSADPIYIGDRWWDLDDLDTICHLFLYSEAQHSQHRWSYDQLSLAKAMTAAGFEGLTAIDKCRDMRLACGVWFQCGWDGYKPDPERTVKDE